MNDEANATLLSVAEALADGLPVDWRGLREREPELADRMERLRALADVASAFREVRTAAGEEPDSQKD